MSRKRRKNKGYSKQKRQEILNSQIIPGGKSEDALIRDFFKQNQEGATEEERMKMAIAMTKFLTGKEVPVGKVQRLMDRAIARDKTLQEYNDNQTEFMENAYEEGARLAKGADKDKIIAQGAETFQKALATANVRKTLRNQKIAERIRTDPTETIYVEPKFETTTVGEGKQTVPVNTELHIAGFTFVLKPGVNKNVPKYVADYYRQLRKSQSQTEDFRQKLAVGDDNHPTMSREELDMELRKLGVLGGEGGATTTLVFGDS